MSSEERDEPNVNPMLSLAMGMLESVAPGALDDCEKASRDLAPKLRFLVLEKVEKPTIAQLEAIRFFDKNRNLVQIRKALQSGKLQFGPFPGDLAETMLMPKLARGGLSVSLRRLTVSEKKFYLGPLKNET